MNPDKPISTLSEDKFQRYEFAKRIAGIVGTPKIAESLVVGLYGKWGEGKTSVLNFIRQELPKETVVVNFNPWLFTSQTELLNAFFQEMAGALGAAKKSIREKIGTAMADYGAAIGSVTKFMGMPLDSVQRSGEVLKNISLASAKTRVDKLIVQANTNIVVFIDDIDRLDVQEIQYIFKLVKLVGDFPRTCYILSFDDEIVATALSEKYRSTQENGGYKYLEKIIQVPLKLPKATQTALRQYTLELLDNIIFKTGIVWDQAEAAAIDKKIEEIFLPIVDNARLLGRYANALSFSLPLLKGEVDTTDLILLEGIKVFFPKFYDFIRENPDIFTDRTLIFGGVADEQAQKTEKNKNIIQQITVYSEKQQKTILALVKYLFPQLSSERISYPRLSGQKKEKTMNLSHPRYFDRYFTYCVLQDDISDILLKNIFSNIANQSVEYATDTVKDLFDNYGVDNVLFKLLDWTDALEDKAIQQFAIAITLNSISLSAKATFLLRSQLQIASIIVSRWLRSLPDNEKEEALFIVLERSDNFDFTIGLWSDVLWSSHDGYYNPPPEDQDLRAKKALVSHFLKLCDSQPFFDILNELHLRFLLRIAHDIGRVPGSIQTIIETGLKNIEGFALRFLKLYSCTVMSAGNKGKQTFKTQIYAEDFEDLNKVFKPEILNNYLLAEFGMHPLPFTPTQLSDRQPASDAEIVSSFQWHLTQLKTNAYS
ncbi:KAP family P-loop NTPase fold protein [Filimonas effusa]|uniref:KAP NTPase domain-containing protein n=1 Tax=Filimonas effusa TaxID=2508721 RepID=A0A4Q1D4N5_9BACT|nr:KAP family NTPase [Filimonas effusa]RXK82896.1 hypothetical protein ESB13_12260 [Filimonas effusa]